MTQQNLTPERIFQSYEVYSLLRRVKIEWVKNNKRVSYANIPCAFDIEVTSFEVQTSGQEKKKQAIMYIWTLSVDGHIIQGRTWQDFMTTCKQLTMLLRCGKNRRLVIYVHNLAYEFQFMHKWFDWEEVFALKKRQPVKALTVDGIEFRCSYKLSGYSLEGLGKQLQKYKIQKMSGDLDYSKIRNSKTPLTEKEMGYVINDVLVVTAYIQEYIERVGNIYDIPTTKTGEVRKYTREQCFYNGENKVQSHDTFKSYRALMRTLTLTSNIYVMLKEAFAGGFTHAGFIYSGYTIRNVRSMDMTSAYPYVMVSEKFPMAKGEKVKVQSFGQLLDLMGKYCCLFRCKITGIRPKTSYENYLSRSHCRKIKGGMFNNGRVIEADYLETTLTEVDFSIMYNYYEWDLFEVDECYTFRKGYLPTNFVRTILELYSDKTTLKGVKGREVDYLLKKERINSMYGMCVTDVCRDKIVYSNEDWSEEAPDLDEAIAKVNKSIKRFLYYPWGVWVTAYTRRNLFGAIKECGEDYVYSDTDSCKFRNASKHLDWFNKYNEKVKNKLERALGAHKLPYNLPVQKLLTEKNAGLVHGQTREHTNVLRRLGRNDTWSRMMTG